MAETVIKLENISKQYRLGTVGSKTLRGDLQHWWYNIRGKEDPSLKIGTSNKLDTREGEYVWALKDIKLEVKKGEILGIIGKNGAGKSTLLKLLSRVTGPTTGSIKVKGRIASLLEVGTGFHPELTGRENIFLNGAILGMTKAEIRSKFDEIVEFAGVAKYIDTPVKRYSSGMYVRLAFAVAAHLEPDILIVDEVLAVGDAEFQKKAIGKMQDVSRGGGRTVLFVSHNMGSIAQLCRQTLILDKGQVSYLGNTNKAVDKYLLEDTSKANIIKKKHVLVDENQFKVFYNSDENNIEKNSYKHDDNIILYVELYLPEWNENLELAISLQDKYKKRIFTIHEPLLKYYSSIKKIIKLQVVIPSSFITPGIYSWLICINYPGFKGYDVHNSISTFTINETGSDFTRYENIDYGYVCAKYEILKLNE